MTLRAFLSVCALTMMGCGDDAGATDAAGDTALPDTSNDAPCTDCTELAFQVELETAAGFVALDDGVVADWEWGFQGGTMIRPHIFFDEGTVEIDQDVRVEVTHAPDPDAPDAYGEVAGFSGIQLNLRVGRDADGRLGVAPIDDQLGWSELNGTRLVLSVRVQAGEAQGTHSGAITLMQPPSPCDVFEQTGGGCSYYIVPGSAEVSVTPSGGLCTDAQRVNLAFTPTDAEGADACAMAQGGSTLRRDYTFSLGEGDPPAACLEALGLSEGATVGASARLIAVGTCAPTGFALDADDGSCSALCTP